MVWAVRILKFGVEGGHSTTVSTSFCKGPKNYHWPEINIHMNVSALGFSDHGQVELRPGSAGETGVKFFLGRLFCSTPSPGKHRKVSLPSLWAGALLVFYSVPRNESLSRVPVLCKILTFLFLHEHYFSSPWVMGTHTSLLGKLFHQLTPRLALSSFSVCYLEISLYS